MIQWEKLYWSKIFLKLLKVEEDFFLGGSTMLEQFVTTMLNSKVILE